MKMRQLVFIALGMVVFGIVLAAVPARAATLTTTISADKDTYVNFGSPSTNYGSSDYYLAGNQSVSSRYTAYFHFPYTAIPAGFLSAAIQIDVFSVSTSFSAHVYYVMDDAWGEYSLNWNNQPYQFGGWLILSTPSLVYSTELLSIDVTTIIADTSGISIAINGTNANQAGYMQGRTSEADYDQPALVYTYLYSGPSGIAGYDVAFLVITSLGIVAILVYKYRNRHST